MTERKGIIPAAGQAERFGGTLKELLPVSEGYPLIERAYDALVIGGCSDIIVVTSLAKLGAIATVLPGCTYRIQAGATLWSAIIENLDAEARRMCFAMPDTYFNSSAFERDFPAELTFGVFETDKPERFGMVRDRFIVDKMPGEPGQAWGVIVWSELVSRLWLKHASQINNYTDALNMAIHKYGYETFDLEYYFDAANMSGYREILSHV
jgi:hypothetical protein